MSTASAIFVADSHNTKIGRPGAKVSSTYASIKGSCPDTCSMKDNGCYAQGGHVAFTVRRLDAAAVESNQDTRDIARAEARAINNSFNGGQIPQDGARGGRDLRIHTAGDARTVSAVKELAKAATNWLLRGGGSAWSYTHAWSTVSRKFWGKISCLASIEKIEQAWEVRRQGYAPALVVATHPEDGKAWKDSTGHTWIPCPAQTQANKSCVDCRLCMNADALHSRVAGIAFAAHGFKTSAIQKRLSLKVI